MSQAHITSRLALQDVLVPTDNDTVLFHYDSTLNSTQGIKPVFNKIRYIRDWTNGNTSNAYNHWVEIQAYDANGVNVALNKTATSNLSATSISRVTDGIISSSEFVGGYTGAQYIQIDLGALYDIKYIKVWHYYADGRTYNSTRVEISHDMEHWVTTFDSDNEGTYVESVNGKTIYLKDSYFITTEEGKYDNCIAIMGSTTNLIRNGDVKDLSYWYCDNDTGSNGAISRVFDTELSRYVYQMAITIKAGWGSYFGNRFSSYTVAPYFDTSAKYTISFKAKSTTGTESVAVSFRNGDGLNIVWNANISITTTWKKYSYTFTPSSTGGSPYFYCISDSNATIRMVDLQLEKNDYGTSFVRSKRANPDFLEYEIPYPPKSVSLWMKPVLGDNRTDTHRYIARLYDGVVTTYWQLYFNASATTTEQNNLILQVSYPNPDNPPALEHRYCICYNVNSTSLLKNANNTKNLLDGNWHFINIWFDNQYAFLRVDDMLIKCHDNSTSSNPNPMRVIPTFTSKKLGVGCSYNAVDRPGNVYIDELRLDNYVYNPQDYALNFNGSTNYISMGNPAILNAKEITFECWAYPTSISGSYKELIAKEAIYKYRINTSGYIEVLIGNAGWFFNATWTTSTVTLNSWNHIACTISDTNKAVEIFLNGVSLGIKYFAGFSIGSNTNGFFIGSFNAGGELFQGYMREARIWNKIRTLAEIQSTMNARLTGSEANLVGYWPLTEGLGATAYDHSTSRNNGTIAGASAYIQYNVNTDEAEAWQLSNKPYYDPYDYSIEVL